MGVQRQNVSVQACYKNSLLQQHLSKEAHIPKPTRKRPDTRERENLKREYKQRAQNLAHQRGRISPDACVPIGTFFVIISNILTSENGDQPWIVDNLPDTYPTIHKIYYNFYE